jgi:hypothetical protein
MIKSATNTASVKPMITFQSGESQKTNTSVTTAITLMAQYPLVGANPTPKGPGAEAVSPRRRHGAQCVRR